MQPAATATPEKPSTTAPRRRAGRPARVHIEQVLDAAIAIGLGEVTLRKVAQRLDVGVATLYRHVGGREELVRMAGFRLALSRQSAPGHSAGASHWAEVVCAYADSLLELFSAQPQLIGELTAGRLPPETEFVFLEPFLTRLQVTGVGVAEGMRLHNAVAMLAIGAAAGAAGTAAVGGGARMLATTRRALAQAGADAYPQVRRGLNCYAADGSAHWRAALAPMLHGFAAARGEQIPAGLIDSPAIDTQTAGKAAQQETAP